MTILLVPLLLVLMLTLIALGYWLAYGRLAEQRQALDAEWQALDNTRRVRAVFLGARLAMRDEALRTARMGQFEHGHHHNQRGEHQR